MSAPCGSKLCARALRPPEAFFFLFFRMRRGLEVVIVLHYTIQETGLSTYDI